MSKHVKNLRDIAKYTLARHDEEALEAAAAANHLERVEEQLRITKRTLNECDRRDCVSETGNPRDRGGRWNILDHIRTGLAKMKAVKETK